MSLGLATFRGIAWNFVEQFLRRGVAAASTLVLSYLLTPGDFGLVSMLALFMALASGLMDSGFREALIRRRKLSERLLNTVLWASTGLGLLAYSLLFVSAPFVAEFYREPDLQSLLRVQGLVVLINGFQVAPAARLAHALNFRAVMRATLPASVISCAVAVLLAQLGYGVWALVYQMLLAALITTVLVWRVAGWMPRLNIDLKPLSALYRFGYKLFLSSLVSIAVKNSVPSILGKYLGATWAGYYYFADRIMELVMGQLVHSVQNVTYSSFSKLGNEGDQLKRAYRKVVEVTVFIVSPILAIASGLAQPLFELLFPLRWQPAAPCFQWICVVYMLYPLHAINLNIIKVKGRSDVFLVLEIIKACISLSVLAVSVRYGLLAVVIGQLLSSALCYIPNSFLSRKMIGYSIFEQMQDTFPYYLISGVCGFVAAAGYSALEGLAPGFGVAAAVAFSGGLFVALSVVCRTRAPGLVLGALQAIKRRVD